MIRVYDDAGNVIETHEHTGDFKQRLWLRVSSTAESNMNTGDRCTADHGKFRWTCQGLFDHN
jgi:hypothetical protein